MNFTRSRGKGGLIHALRAVQCELGRAAVIFSVLTIVMILASACQKGGGSGGTDKDEQKFYINAENQGASLEFSVAAPHCMPLESATLAGVGDADSITVAQGFVDFTFIFTVDPDLSQGEIITVGPQCDIVCQLFGWNSATTCGPWPLQLSPENGKTLKVTKTIWNKDIFYEMIHQGNRIPNSGRVYLTIYAESDSGEKAEATGYADFSVRCVETGQ